MPLRAERSSPGAIGGAYRAYARRPPLLPLPLPNTPHRTKTLSSSPTSTTKPAIQFFDDTLKTALSVSLSQSPFLNVLSEGNVEKTLKLMTRPPDTRLTPDVARELCQRAGSKAYIAGSIAGLGSQYVLELKVVNCENGDTLGREQATAARKEKVLDTLGKAASKLRGELERRSLADGAEAGCAAGTRPPRLLSKPYRPTHCGREAYREKSSGAALPYHQRAIEPATPILPWATSKLATITTASSNRDGRSGITTRHFNFAIMPAGQRESLHITAFHYESVTGELEKAAQTYREWSCGLPAP